MDNPRAQTRLTTIASYYLNWQNGAGLPKPMYDMDILTMNILFQIQGDVNAMVNDANNAKIKELTQHVGQ